MPTLMNAPLLDAAWTAIKARLDTATPAVAGQTAMRTILGGAGRVYVVGVDTIPDREGAENADWGRLVIVPTDTLWPRLEVAYETQHFSFNLLAEFNDWKADGYYASRGLDLAQFQAYWLLDAWLPTSLSNVLFVLPITRRSAPTSARQNQDRGVLVTSSYYRAEIVGAS